MDLGLDVEERDGFCVCERGIGIPVRSVSDYPKGLLYLLDNGRLRESLAEKGRAFVEEKYSKDRLVDDIAKLYRSVTEKN